MARQSYIQCSTLVHLTGSKITKQEPKIQQDLSHEAGIKANTVLICTRKPGLYMCSVAELCQVIDMPPHQAVKLFTDYKQTILLYRVNKAIELQEKSSKCMMYKENLHINTSITSHYNKYDEGILIVQINACILQSIPSAIQELLVYACTCICILN